MEGISIIHNETNGKKYVQIALEILEENQSTLEDLLDTIIAESRKNDPTISLEELKKRLQKSGQL